MKLVRLLNTLREHRLYESVEMFGDVPVLVNSDVKETEALIKEAIQTLQHQVGGNKNNINIKGLWDPRGRVYIWDGSNEHDSDRHHITIAVGIIERYGHPDTEDFYYAFDEYVDDDLMRSFEEDGMLLAFSVDYYISWPGSIWKGQEVLEPMMTRVSPWFVHDAVAKTPEVQRAFGGTFKESINEAREADLYHWLYHDKAAAVFDLNRMNGEWVHEVPYTNQRLQGTSMSRNPYFHLGRPFRFVFDQDKLARSNKIVPLDAERTFQHTKRYSGWEKSPDRDKHASTTMAEEFVLGDIAPLNRYLKRIEIDDLELEKFSNRGEDVRFGPGSVQSIIAAAIQYGEKFGIPIAPAPGRIKS